MSLDIRPPLEPIFQAFAVQATNILPKGGTPIPSADVIPPSGPGGLSATRSAAVGSEAAVLELRDAFTFRKDQVPVLPVGSTFEAPLLGGGEVRHWTVDRVDGSDPELWRALVH